MTQLPADYLSSASPYFYDQPLPAVARANAVTQVPPAKKITFYKSGDPQFAGVKMAINQRSFKSFNALMDDLSHRVPLPFGVRTITTPRGIHCISTLDQLEDGGCYLCSDKKYVTPISIGTTSRRSGPRKNSHPANSLRRAAQEMKRDDFSTAQTQHSPWIAKKITLVKNGDVTTQRSIILNRRNTRSFKAFLEDVSEIMQFTVKKLYTLDGKKIDTMQALLHSPNMLICVGREPFKSLVGDSTRKRSSERLPGLTSQPKGNNAGENNEMNFGLKAKKSVIHPRSVLSNRSMRFSLSSEKSYANGLTTSSENGALPSSHCPCSKAGDLVHSLVNDDIEKKVHVNKDGSLSVEMKVRFRLLNDETLQWSTQIKKSSMLHNVPGEESGVDKDNGKDSIDKMSPEGSFEADNTSYPCNGDSCMSNPDESENDGTHCHTCSKACKDYDIWKNPMHMSSKEDPSVMNTWYTHSSCSSTSSHQRVVRQKVASMDSVRTSSSGEEYSKHVVQESSHYSETVENRVEYRRVQKCCCRPRKRIHAKATQKESLEEASTTMHLGRSNLAREGGDENQGGQVGSSPPQSSCHSADSQIKVCEEISSMERTISSCSVKEGVVEITNHSSTPSSVGSKSTKRSLPVAKESLDEASEKEPVISSFSSESCPKKGAAEGEEEGSERQHSASSQSVSDCGRCSTEMCVHLKTHEGKSIGSRSSETQMCSAASTSSRTSKKSKRSKTGSKASSRSSQRSTVKKTKTSLSAEEARSESRPSCYSRSSNEVEKRDVGGHASCNTSVPHSNVSSLSEAAAPPVLDAKSTSSSSKCYSKSSKGSQKESQPEDTSKTSSACSSFSQTDVKNEGGAAHVSSETPSSRAASMSKSICSKCGHVVKDRNDDLQSVSSRIASYSENQCAEMETSERSDNLCSQSNTSQSSKPRQKKGSLQANVELSTQTSASELVSMYGVRCPVPPKGKPSGRKSRAHLLKKASNGTSACADSEATADKEQKEEGNAQPPEMEPDDGPGRPSDPPSEGGEKSQQEAEVEDDNEIIPSSLPNASPEEVVHEWLKRIPSEPLLMQQDEMQDDGEGTELDAKGTCSSRNPESQDEKSEGNKEDGEGCESQEVPETADGGAEEEAIIEEASKEPSEDKASKAMLEDAEADQAECNQSVFSSQNNNHKKDLPSTVQTSVQILKALLASKQEAKLDRSHSLPEVSPTMGRKLSNSANILITCLASLQFLDEELDQPSKSSKCPNRSRYTELFNIFQALWLGCTSEKGGTSSGLQGEGQEKLSSAFKGHNSKDGDFTPMSSSGVDVSSGDGASGEGSMAGANECAMSPEKTDEAKTPEGEPNTAEAGLQEEQDECSQPPTPRSKSEAEETAKSDGGEEVDEDNEAQCSDCEAELKEDKEMNGEEEMEEKSIQIEENVTQGEGDAEGDTNQEETQEGSVIEETQEGSVVEETQEGSVVEETQEGSVVEETQEGSVVEETQEGSVVEETQEETQEGSVVEETQEETQEGSVVEETQEGSVVEETQEETQEGSVVEETQEETQEGSVVEETQEGSVVEETQEGSVVEETQEETQEGSVVEETQEETQEGSVIEETQEGSVVEETQEGSVVEETQEGSVVEETQEGSVVEETQEGSVVEETQEGSVVEETQEGSVVEETQEGSVVEQAEDSPCQENTDEVPEEPPDEAEPGLKENEANEGPEMNTEGQTTNQVEAEMVTSDIVPQQATVKVSALTQQGSVDPDPVWVLKLLKKIEKEFMTHYVSAMDEFKVKWNLPNSEELEMMITELRDEVSKRIQSSIEKELKKIQSRAGRRVAKPPDNDRRRKSTLQVQNRRYRLKSIHKMSLYSDRNLNQSEQLGTREMSEDINKESFLFSTFRDDISEQPSDEEYCPCDTCIRKKMAAKAARTQAVVVVANAPVVKAFDLQQILRMNKGNVATKKDPEIEPEADEKEKEGGETIEEGNEDEAETLAGEEDAPGDQDCGEAGAEEMISREGEEEAKEEEAEEEAEEGGEKEEEEQVTREGNEAEEELETKKVEEEGEEEAAEETLEEEGEQEEREEEEEEAKAEEEAGSIEQEGEEGQEGGEEEEKADEGGETAEQDEVESVKQEEQEEKEEEGEKEGEETGVEEEVESVKQEEEQEEGEEAEEGEETAEQEELEDMEQEEKVEETEEEAEDGVETVEQEEVESVKQEEEQEEKEEEEEKEEGAEGEGETKAEEEMESLREEEQEVDEEMNEEKEMDAEQEMEEEAAGSDHEIQEETEGGVGEEGGEDASAMADTEAISEAAQVEEAGENDEINDAGEEAAAGGDDNEPLEDNGDEDPEEKDEEAETLRKNSKASSVGNCSHLSQKGSEDGEECKEEEEEEENGDGDVKPNEESRPEKMYPDSDDDDEEEEEEEEKCSASSQATAGKTSKPKKNKDNSSQVSYKKHENSDAIDQDDLDF